MLLNNLYTVEKKSASEAFVTFEIALKAGHPLYQGHFPGQPVTPGVILGEIVKELMESWLKVRLRMTDMRQIKFLKLHDPVTNPVMEILLKWEEAEGYLLQATGRRDSDVFFKMTARYQTE